MAITREDALNYSIQEFHLNGCYREIGSRGGVVEHTDKVRRNGSVQTWKTRPNDFRMPVKYGISARGQFSIDHNDCQRWHKPEDCPLVQQPEGEVNPRPAHKRR